MVLVGVIPAAWSAPFEAVLRPGSRRTEEGLAAAIAWRVAMLVRIDTLSRREFCEQKRSNNTSGVPGVHFLKTARQPLGLWQAKIKRPDGRKVHKSFSVRRFGEQRAFRMAVAARMEMLLLIDAVPYIKHPTAKRFLTPIGGAQKSTRSLRAAR